MKRESLRKSALESCNLRGHNMTRFNWVLIGKGPAGKKWHGGSFWVGHSECTRCGKYVMVDEKPQPNGINISGDAVALGCND
jgi:hypothetical protein